MEEVRQQIRELLAASQSPAVLCSFGKDSLLLLALVREVRSDVPVIWFRDAATPETTKYARRLIREWNLNVYSYHPADVYLLADGEHTSLIQEYSFGEHQVPLVIDLEQGEACSLAMFAERTPQLFLPFDLLLTGFKDADDHWLRGGAEMFQAGLRFGRAQVVAPIRHLTDEQVRAALVELNIPYKELDDRISVCTACMTGTEGEVWCPLRRTHISREQWDAEQSLSAFRERFTSGATK